MPLFLANKNYLKFFTHLGIFLNILCFLFHCISAISTTKAKTAPTASKAYTPVMLLSLIRFWINAWGRKPNEQTNKQTRKLRHFADLKLNKSRNLSYFSAIIATLRYLSKFAYLTFITWRLPKKKKKKRLGTPR